jgi:hypothetical protein
MDLNIIFKELARAYNEYCEDVKSQQAMDKNINLSIDIDWFIPPTFETFLNHLIKK